MQCQKALSSDKIEAAYASPLIAQIENLDSIKAFQIKLKNGMTVCLKPIDTEGEVLFKLSALGSYASLDEKDFFSGAIADEIAWESGFGGMTSDQMSLFLYENSLELILAFTPFSRTVEAEGRKDSLEAYFQCVRMMFTQQQFTEEGYETAKTLSREIINKLSHDNDHVYENAFLRVNTQNFAPLRPVTVEDLNKVSFDKAKKFFQRCFSDPSDFYCVVVGNFDVKVVMMLVEKYLASIPRPQAGSELKKHFNVPFPPGITETTFRLPNHFSCLTHVTFPLQIPLNEMNIHEIAFMCQIIEARLRNVITEKMNLSYGVDVAYEFPVYPFLDNPWISIRYRCEKNFIVSLKEIVISELKNLQSKGATAHEVATIKKLEEGGQEFWLKDDFYWVSMLSNYYLWGWNPEKIDYKNTPLKNISLEEINSILKQAIHLTNYSVVTANP